MRGLVKSFFGIVFLMLFLLSLALSAVELKLLREDYWTKSLAKSGIYQELTGKLHQAVAATFKDFNSQAGQQLSKLPPDKRREFEKNTAFITSLEKAGRNITADKIQNFAETNISRLLSFLNGQTTTLFVYVPLTELGVDSKSLQPPFSQLTAETDAKVFLGAFLKNPDQAIAALHEAQRIVGIAKTVWLGLLAATLLVLVGFWFLGQDMVGRLKGVSWLLLICGGVSAAMALGVRGLVTNLLANAANVPPYAVRLIPDLVNEFFSVGLIVGGVVAGAGLLGVLLLLFFSTKKRS